MGDTNRTTTRGCLSARWRHLPPLHLRGDTTRVAPFYDLVCTRAIERIGLHLALDVGGERNPSATTLARWETLAKRCDVRPQFLRNLVRETAAALQDRLGPTRQAFEAHYGAYPALQRIERIVTQQCRRIDNAIAEPLPPRV